jgi:tetratricopeptide (TPR) repeat protein
MAKKRRRKKVRPGRTKRASGRARGARAPAAKAAVVVPPKVVDPRVAQVMKFYEEAMRHFNHQNFRRAKEILEKVLAGPSRELAERARVHLVICEQRLQRAPAVHLRGADDHYHYAVSQINSGNYEEARAHLEKARKLAPKADHVYYALASVAALTGEPEEACKHLAQAIKLRPENRYHARNDSDFKPLEDDVRFQELLYPERGGARLTELRT